MVSDPPLKLVFYREKILMACKVSILQGKKYSWYQFKMPDIITYTNLFYYDKDGP